MLSRIATAGLALTLGLAAPAASAATAAGADSRIYSAPATSFGATKSKRFAVNPELGRAWVELTMDHRLSEYSETIRIEVPGLRYDAGQREIVLDRKDGQVVCASLVPRGWGWFRHDRIEPTGACALTHRHVEVPVDDGFNVTPVRQLEVHLTPTGTRDALQVSTATP